MKTVLRWAIVYLILLTGLTALGHYNQRLNASLQTLHSTEADLARKETKLLLEHYRLVSPLALHEWAKANGYIPMSLARWDDPRLAQAKPVSPQNNSWSGQAEPVSPRERSTP